MKLVILIDLKKKKPEERIVTFMHNEPGPLPPIVTPDNEDEAKNGGPPKEEKPS